MSKPPDIKIPLDSVTLSLCGYTFGGSEGYWLYDKTRGMNLAMRAETPTEAFVEALHYYQERLTLRELELALLQSKVDAFVSQFVEHDEGFV
jgi:hypothetical protein